ncbi:MAG: helix-turn-helix transcriptional regulator [Desulfobacter sp.]
MVTEMVTAKNLRKILRKSDVKKILGLRGDSSLDRLEKDGVLPPRVKISPFGRAVGWFDDDIGKVLDSIRQQQVATSDTSRIGQGKPGPGRGHKRLAA